MSDSWFAGAPLAGQTSQMMAFRLVDASDGSDVTGKTAADLTAYYWRNGGTPTSITLSDLAAIDSAFSAGGIKEADATHMPGLYRLDIPNAALATGADWVVLSVLCSGAVTYQVQFTLSTEGTDTLPAIKAQTDKLTYDGSNNVKSTPQTDPAGVTTLLGRLTSPRAGYLDLLNTYLNYSVSALAGIANAVKAKTDNLPADPAGQTATDSSIAAAQAAIQVDTAAIQAKTDNLPASPAAVGSKMDLQDSPNSTAIAAIQNGLATAANLTMVLNRLGAWTGTGANTILGAFRALLRKDVDAAAPTDINADLGSGAGTFDNTEDSVEAIRDRGDAAWGASGAPSETTIANKVWDTLRSGHTISGSFGEGVASVRGAVTGAVASVTGAVGSVSGNVGGNLVGNVNGNLVGNVSGSVPDSSGTTTLLARLSDLRARNIDSLSGWSGTLLDTLRAMARKDASASADLGGTFDSSSDSEQAIAETLATLTPGTPTDEQTIINELNT